MPHRKSRRGNGLSQAVILAVIGVAVLALILGAFYIPRQMQGAPANRSSPQNTAAADLGVTYLSLTPGVAAYYNLGVESGALITQIAPDSLADKAGLKVGDVIMSFNGIDVEKGSSLLSAVMNCPVGDNVLMEICRGKVVQTVSFIHRS